MRIKLLLFTVLVACSTLVRSQVVTTLDYSTVTWNQNLCNVFNETNAKVLSNLTHWPIAGGAMFRNPPKELEMRSAAPTEEGTAFMVNYKFQPGFTYTVTINAKSSWLASTEQAPIFAVTPLTQPYPDADINPECDAAAKPWWDQIYASSVGNKTIDVTSSFKNYTIITDYNPGSTTYNFLAFLAIGGNNGGPGLYATTFIKTITITKKAKFEIPFNVSIDCGATNSRTFLVTNGLGTTGITEYTWVFPASSGWKHNGVPATGTISTGTTPSITLVSNTSANAQPFYGVVKAQGGSFSTNICTPQKNIPTSTSVSGNALLCTGSATYTLTNVPAGGAVTWTYNQSNPGVATYVSSGNSITVTKSGSGWFTLKGSFNACGTVLTSTLKSVRVGAYTGSDYDIYQAPAPACVSASQIEFGFQWNPLYPPAAGTTYSWIYDGRFDYISGMTGQVLRVKLKPGVIDPGNAWVMGKANNTCGAGPLSGREYFSYVLCFSGMTVGPNPANSEVFIQTDKSTMKQGEVPAEIQEVEIVDKLGNVAYRQKFGKGVYNVKVPVSKMKNDVYTIKVFNGKTWTASKVIIKH